MNFPDTTLPILFTNSKGIPGTADNNAPVADAKNIRVNLPMILGICLMFCLSLAAQAQTATRHKAPTIIFLLTDDQGYGDLACTGNPILKTPNLDRLHDEGVRFTDFHVSPTCSPTRSALMTGRHEFKNGVTHTIYERERLTLKAITLAEALKSAGYTTGIFGKWHLGDEDAYQPNRRGFEEVFVHGGGGIGQTYPGSCGDAPGNTYFNPAVLHNGRFEKTQGYCTDVFFGQALQWMEKVKGKRPFFAYIPCNAPHEPLQVRPEDEARYISKTNDLKVAKFFGMIANIDDNVGRLLDRLNVWGIERETLVVFMNDNGGTGGVKVYNAGMRGQKVTAFLGGTRAASFWRWPGTLQSADVTALTAHIDFFPTLAEIAGVKLRREAKQQIEGLSLLPCSKTRRLPGRTACCLPMSGAGRRERLLLPISLSAAAFAAHAGIWSPRRTAGRRTGYCSMSKPTMASSRMWPRSIPTSCRIWTLPTIAGGIQCSPCW